MEQSTNNVIDISPDVIVEQTWDEVLSSNQGQQTGTIFVKNTQASTSTVAPTGVIAPVGTSFASTNFVPNLSGWKLGSNGVLEAIGVILSGDISATTGHIGGFSIAATSITDLVGSFGMDSTVTAGDDIRFWAGSATPASAPFYVTEAGVLMASSGTIAGWTIGATSISKSTIVLDSANDKITVGGTDVILDSSGITAIAGTIGGFTLGSNSLIAGAGASYISLNTSNGIHLGNSNFASAPFSVSLAGELTATNATIEGNITADTLTASTGTIGGFTIDATSLYGGVIKTASTVGVGANGVLMDTAGIRGYSATLGTVFNLPTDGSAPTFASGVIENTIFEVNTSASIRTSSTVGDGTANSAGILINDTGLYACGASQTPSTANVKILVDGSAVFTASVKGGQTDYATGTGYFLGLSGGDYKFSIGSTTNYMRWDGTYLILKGSFDVGTNGVINNSSYTVANLPTAPTVVGYNVPSAYE